VDRLKIITLEQRIVKEVGRLLNNTNNPQHGAIGHLATAAARSAESLVYLAELDEIRFGNVWTNDKYNNASIDDGHVRWAAAGALSSLDLCIAAAGRLNSFKLKRTPGKEYSIRNFYWVNSKTGKITDKRNNVTPPWRGWIDSVINDSRYTKLLQIRNALIHTDAFRIVHGSTETISGHDMRYEYRMQSLDSSQQGSSSPIMKAREIVELACDVAMTHVEGFIVTLKTLP